MTFVLPLADAHVYINISVTKTKHQNKLRVEGVLCVSVCTYSYKNLNFSGEKIVDLKQ